jgi:hypothetical protein
MHLKSDSAKACINVETNLINVVQSTAFFELSRTGWTHKSSQNDRRFLPIIF